MWQYFSGLSLGADIFKQPMSWPHKVLPEFYRHATLPGGNIMALDEILSQSNAHPLKQQAATSMARVKSGSSHLASTLSTNVSFNTSYKASRRLTPKLRTVARSIAGTQKLGMKRQTFFVGAVGWDTLDN